MGFFASVDGVVTPAAEARVSVLDNGFTFGDAAYEVLRTYAGRPFEWERHLRRLRASCARLGFAVPQSDVELLERANAVLSRAGNDESYVRVIVSRGVGDISYDFSQIMGPTVVIVVKPHRPYPEWHYTDGIPVALVSVRRNHPQALDPAIKSCNLLNSVLAIREAQSRGGEEAVLLNQAGEVAEGASTNVWIVRAGEVVTPPLTVGILAGITREVVLELAAQEDLKVREVPFRAEALLAADEIFLTSSTREIVPVRAVDGQVIGAGRLGPVTSRLLQAFRARAHGTPPKDWIR
jgi:branched-chain amino acid aminotransferase